MTGSSDKTILIFLFQGEPGILISVYIRIDAAFSRLSATSGNKKGGSYSKMILGEKHSIYNVVICGC